MHLVYVCEWCNKIKEAPDREPKIKLSDLSEEQIIDTLCNLTPTPHYICPNCLRRILEENK